MILSSPPFFPPKACSCLALSLYFSWDTSIRYTEKKSSFILIASSASAFHPFLNATLALEHNTVSKLTYARDHLLVVTLIFIISVWEMTQGEKFDQTAFIVWSLTKTIQNHSCFNVVQALAECSCPAFFTLFCGVFCISLPSHTNISPRTQN